MAENTRAIRKQAGAEVDKAIIDSSITIDPFNDPEFPSAEGNLLKQYASYTYRWVLAALTPEQLQSGSYKQADGSLTPGSMVLGEGGFTGPDGINLRSDTFYGTPEFFVNSVEIKIIAGMVAAAGGSGNFSCKFEVFEPHSLGLFLQSVQAAAQRVGFGLNYVQCPFMFRCDFLGWELGLDGLPKSSSKVIASRHFVINFREIKFTANETGSIYQVDAIHYDNMAFANTADSPITQTTKIVGRTVSEALKDGDQGLQSVLNASRQKLKEKALDASPDEFIIEFADELFPDLFKAPQGKIGSSKFNQTMADPPSALTGSESASTESKARNRDKVQLVNGVGAFQFNAGQSITDMIKEVMLHSEYCQKALENPDKDDGTVSWFRISAKINFEQDKADPVKNRLQKIIKYIITPYKIHHSLFKHPSKPAVGFDKLKRMIKKKYDYLFTGQNDDILKWELKFDGTWYKAMDPSGLENTQARDASRAAANPFVAAKRIPIGQAGEAQARRITDSYRLEFDRNSIDHPFGGAYADTEAIKAARQFQKAAQESKDLMRIQLEIIGDPYYMAESGSLDKSNVPSVDNPFITDTGIMTSEVTEIRTFVRFKTPIDVPAVGSLYEFPSNGRAYSPFSGLYRIIFVTHMFKDGQFTQVLDMIRDRDQQLSDELNKTVTDKNLAFYEGSFTIDAAQKTSASN
jgi:hypothetical protein